MEIEDIRKLVELMVANGLSELDISDGDSKVSLRRHQGQVVVAPPVPAPAAYALPAPAAAPAPAAPAEDFLEIKSPMVGTFYAAPSPDSDPFITVGSRVSSEKVVCIIEAMKVMNEIKAEVAGTVVEVAVENGRPVEYGQVLFRVRP